MGNNKEVGVEEGVVLEQLDSHEMVEFGGNFVCVMVVGEQGIWWQFQTRILGLKS